MRKHLVLGALIACSLGVANVHGGIFGRGGGCPNGQCGGYSGGGYYATTTVKSPSDVAVQTTSAQPAVAAQAASPATPAAASQVETAPRTYNVSTGSSTRGRFFRRWAR